MQTAFPFTLEDLQSWTVKRTDGSVTTFKLLSGGSTQQQQQQTHHHSNFYGRTTHGFGDFCTHTPGGIPSASFDRGDNPLNLWVANMIGARTTKDLFDFVIDGGDIFNSWTSKSTLDGDRELSSILSPYTDSGTARILKIDWDDRKAPPVTPEFWTRLNDEIYGDVMTCCVGGHGRSGSSFVCLLLVNAPDYDALDAMVHIRAVHCPRAIESLAQHEYINKVALYLNRKDNALDAQKVLDYKALFMDSTKPTAIATKKLLGW